MKKRLWFDLSTHQWCWRKKWRKNLRGLFILSNYNSCNSPKILTIVPPSQNRFIPWTVSIKFSQMFWIFLCEKRNQSYGTSCLKCWLKKVTCLGLEAQIIEIWTTINHFVLTGMNLSVMMVLYKWTNIYFRTDSPAPL